MLWVGQKVHSGFTVRVYGKTQTDFLSNTIYTIKSTVLNVLYNDF